MVGEILGILGKVAGGVADRIFPDPEQELKRIELQQALQAAVLERTSEIERAAADVVKAEAQGQSWLQRTWRPITMLVFVSLIVARWLGWSAPNLSEAEVLKLWDIVEIGLGGYVIGRSAEKILPGILQSLRGVG
jgi:Holin of 3TMs, for gene-transfer release